MGYGEGVSPSYSLPIRLRGLEERRKLHQRGPGGAPVENDFNALKHHRMLLVALRHIN